MEQLALLPSPGTPAIRRRDLLDNPDWLAREYATRDLKSLAAEIGCSPTTVGARLQTYGIRPRRPGEKPHAERDVPVGDLLHHRVATDLARGDVGETVLAQRIRAMLEARQAGDQTALRAALVDLGAASVAWAQGLTPGDTPKR